MDAQVVTDARPASNDASTGMPSHIHKHANEETRMSTTGQKPGKGTYKCTNCSTTVTLDDANDTLPPCPKCGKSSFAP